MLFWDRLELEYSAFEQIIIIMSTFPSGKHLPGLLERFIYVTQSLWGVWVCICLLQDPSDLRCPSVPLCQTKKLVGRLFEMLPENHAQYNLALHLLEALEALTAED